jgi:hypothetical protein
MQQLLDAIGEDRWILVTSVTSERRNLVLRFESFPAPTDGSIGAWLVSCRQVREFSLTDFDGGGLNFWTKNHPLLSQFSSQKAQSVDDWIDFDRFVPNRTNGRCTGPASVWSKRAGEAELRSLARHELRDSEPT